MFEVFQSIYNTYSVTTATTSSLSPSAWEESTGLLSSLIPQTTGSAAPFNNAQAFNQSKGELKLGPAPLQDDLKSEAERVLREQAMVDRDPTSQYDLHYLQPPALPGTTAPTLSELLPHPPNFKTVDVKREVERVRDARKRIRLEPSTLSNVDHDSPQAATLRARALPSVCAYTIHNVPEG
jgi:transcription initiation factor TFIID subunit 5